MMTTKPDTVTASVSEPEPIPARPTLYAVLYPEHGGNPWSIGCVWATPERGELRQARVPGSVLLTIPGSTPPHPPAAQTPAPPASEQDTTPATDGRIRCECGHICPAPTPKAEPKPEDYKGVHNADEDHEHWPEDQPKPAEERVRWFRMPNQAPDDVGKWRLEPNGDLFFHDCRGNIGKCCYPLDVQVEFFPDSPAPKDAESVGEDPMIDEVLKVLRCRCDRNLVVPDEWSGKAADTINSLRSQLAAMTERAEKAEKKMCQLIHAHAELTASEEKPKPPQPTR